MSEIFNLPNPLNEIMQVDGTEYRGQSGESGESQILEWRMRNEEKEKRNRIWKKL